MPRRAVLSDEQRAALLALPDDETLLVQHWTLSRDDLAIIVRRRRPHNRLGFAIQLCALRYPGRFLRPGELIPDTPLAFVAEQLQVGPEVLADYATRGPTRYEQLDALRDAFGFMPLSRPLRTTLQEWLLPIALTTTSGARLARVMLDECRRRRIIVPGISSVERMVAQALLDAERHVAEHLTRGLDARQRRLLDALLLPHTGTNLSDLAWVRQSPGKPGRKTFAAIIERLTLLRAIGIDPDIAVGVHPERLRRLCQEGVRLTAQHVRTLQATRRRATLVATILETIVTLTDDAVLMFDRLLGQMFRREQNSADTTLKRNRRTINGKIRLLAQLGAALLAAKISGGDIGAAVEAAIGWNDLGREVDEARKLIRPDSVDRLVASARGNLRSRARPACRRPTHRAAGRAVRVRHLVQLRRSELSARPPRPGNRRSQSAQGDRAGCLLLQPRLGSLRAVPFHSYLRFGERGGTGARRAAPPRRRSAHRRASRRWRGRLRPCVRAMSSAWVPVRAAYPEYRRTPFAPV